MFCGNRTSDRNNNNSRGNKNKKPINRYVVRSITNVHTYYNKETNQGSIRH